MLTWHRHCSRAMQDIFGDLVRIPCWPPPSSALTGPTVTPRSQQERDPIVEGLDFDMYSYSPELNAASLRSSPAPPAPTSFLLPLGCDELMTDEAPDGLVSFPGEGGGCQFASRRMKRPPHPRPRLSVFLAAYGPLWHQLTLLGCAVAIATGSLHPSASDSPMW